ncbi:hypothetical protein CVT24_002132 [Panaeolus cyanescens]|uniref:Uncharacterized protein n=1 Tax=Panaeolus cyanescens TaxID=181874 RepID=A0A409YHZ7_9AGAR|nr:hypothetical protein CVT24_002132 [Panaeolus cyanescens]
MGKWTPDYIDEVLQHKVSSLVTGAIRRAAVEKDIQPMTYECFVKELDTGDSFTTTIIDILVKEVADRQHRLNPTDRRLVADRTVRALRSLASARPYIGGRPARHVSRRHILSDYPGAPHMDTDLIDDEDDDELASFLDPPPPPSVLEGTRINSEIYDALNPWPHNPPSSVTAPRVIPASPSPVSDEWPVIRPWSAAGGASTAPSTLSRQASIRRAQRSRVVDFNEFTHRRRITNRDARGESATGAEAREGNAGTGSTSAPAAPTSTSAWSSGGAVRRFFPFPPRSSFNNLARRAISPATAPSFFEYSPESPSQTFGPHYYEIVGSALPIRSSSADASTAPGPSTAVGAETPDDVLTRAPRLRRGGVRPPETLPRPRSPVFVVTASPTLQAASAGADDDMAPIDVMPLEPMSTLDPSMARIQASTDAEPTPSPPEPPTPASGAAALGARSVTDDIVGALLAVEELVSYPTPGSTENENLT